MQSWQQNEQNSQSQYHEYQNDTYIPFVDDQPYRERYPKRRYMNFHESMVYLRDEVILNKQAQKAFWTTLIGGLTLAFIIACAFFWISSSVFTRDTVEYAHAKSPSTIGLGQYVTIQRDGPLIDLSADLTDYEKAVARKLYDETMAGNKDCLTCGIPYDDTMKIMQALGFAYYDYTYRDQKWLGWNNVYWTYEENSLEDIIAARKAVNDALDAAGIEDGMSASRAVYLINSYLCQTVTYDEEILKHSALDAFNGEAVCSGYALAFQMMCTACNIPCAYVVGYAGESQGPHAWNAVYLDGLWYYIDVTWNDSSDNAYYTTTRLWDNHTLGENQRDFTDANSNIDKANAKNVKIAITK